jgi:hypothetical protein
MQLTGNCAVSTAAAAAATAAARTVHVLLVQKRWLHLEADTYHASLLTTE